MDSPRQVFSPAQFLFEQQIYPLLSGFLFTDFIQWHLRIVSNGDESFGEMMSHSNFCCSWCGVFISECFLANVYYIFKRKGSVHLISSNQLSHTRARARTHTHVHTRAHAHTRAHTRTLARGSAKSRLKLRLNCVCCYSETKDVKVGWGWFEVELW